MTVARAWAEQSTCLRGRAGAVVTNSSGRVLGSGYNGAAKGLPHCVDAGCLLEPAGFCGRCDGVGALPTTKGDCHECLGTKLAYRCVRSVHAEVNAILFANQSVKDGRIYVTTRPCVRCMTMIAQAGITQVVFEKEYDSDNRGLAIAVAQSASIGVFKLINGELERQ